MTEVNFKNSIIYKVVSPNTENYTIGTTTTSSLQDTLQNLKATCFLDGNLAKFILKAGQARLELIEKYPCNSRAELDKRRVYWIRKSDENCLNKINQNSEKVKERKRLYRQQEHVKERINMKRKERYHNDPEFREKKQKQNQKSNERPEAKAKKQEYNKTKIECVCGVIHSRKAKHPLNCKEAIKHRIQQKREGVVV